MSAEGPSRLRFVVSLTSLLGVALLPDAAKAREASQNPPVFLAHASLPTRNDALKEMEALLAQVDDESKHLALWLAVANLTVGAGHVAGASFAMHRGATGPAIGTFVGAGFSLASGLLGLTLGRAPFRPICETFAVQRSILPPDDAIENTLQAWRKEAKAVRRFRTVFGGAMATAGTLMVGFSTANLIANIPWPSRHSAITDRAAFGGVLLGLSGFVFVNGVTMLTLPGPIETRLPLSRAAGLSRPTDFSHRPQWQLALSPQGAHAQMALAF